MPFSMTSYILFHGAYRYFHVSNNSVDRSELGGTCGNIDHVKYSVNTNNFLLFFAVKT